MAAYVIGDIHNSVEKFDKMLEKLSPSIQDHIYLLGDRLTAAGLCLTRSACISEPADCKPT